MELEEELKIIEEQLDELLACGSNDEKLVTRKREIQKQLRESVK
ncbi:hypothetical protein [Flavobacterium covae]|nr:hypothetical protein [Flavobacterium covae]